MKKPKAVSYGQLELIPGIICDAYVLDNGDAVMSERGVAKLLGIYHNTLQSMANNGLPNTLKPFIDKDFSMTVTLVEVTANNSPYKGRKITVYDSKCVESLMRAYALANGNNVLRKNQVHIGRRCVILLVALVRTALETAIKQACGLNPNIQQIAQLNYAQVGQMMKDSGLTSSIGNDIYTKKDITNYINVPLSTLNNNISKFHDDISAINLDRATIRAIGSKAPRMNAYNLEDVGKIILGMDSVIGIELKKQVFGTVGTLAKLDTKGEIE